MKFLKSHEFSNRCLFIMLILIFTLFTGALAILWYFVSNVFKSKQEPQEYIKPAILYNHNWTKSFETFAKALTFKTVSRDVGDLNEPQIKELINYLEKAFPRVHSCPWIERRVIDNLSLLYVCDPGKRHGKTVNAKNERSENKPWVIIAHLDVVPVDSKDLLNWKYDPYAGQIDPNINDDESSAQVNSGPIPPNWFKRFIYGRGSLDVKNIVLAVLEALESHLERDMDTGSRYSENPPPPLYLVFGCDEEVGGLNGAKVISKLLANELNFKGGEDKPISFIIDEGTNVYTDFPVKPNSDNSPKNIACVSVSEKSTVKFVLTTQLGNTEESENETQIPVNPDIPQSVYHSSIPPPETALTRLARASVKISNHKFPVSTHMMVTNRGGGEGEDDAKSSTDLISEISRKMAPCVSDPLLRIMMANVAVFRKFLVNRVFSKHSMLNSCLRTTSCVTIFKSGIKDNVIPNRAEAMLNQRIHPSQTVEQVIAINEKIIGDSDVKMKLVFNGPRIPISSTNSRAYKLISRNIKHIFGSETVILPFILPASTDSKHFIELTEDIYRFTPVALKIGDLNRFHGINERISLASYAQCVNFYYSLIGEKLHLLPN